MPKPHERVAQFGRALPLQGSRPRFESLRAHLLLDRRNEVEAPARQLLKLKREIADLPETAATFRATNYIESRGLHTEDFAVIKSWRIPKHLKSVQKYAIYVNPNYIYKDHYSDIAVYCNHCDSVFSTDVSSHRKHDPTFSDRLLQRRIETTRQLLKYGWYDKEIATRLGISRSRLSNIFINEGYSLSNIASQSRSEMVDDWQELYDAGLNSIEIGELYDRSDSTVRTYLNNY